MRIGLISDTHVPEAVPELPWEVELAFSGADLILHAGDMHVIDVLDWLERIAPVLSVRGNGDYPTSYNPNRPASPTTRGSSSTPCCITRGSASG